MANTYTISTTDGSGKITIQAGSYSGNVTGSATQDTDLLLYGRGAFNWGEGIEQNLVRLTENWAVVAENPTAAANAQYPKISDINSNVGISAPLLGQTWFNKSNKRLYVNVDGLNKAGSWKLDAEDRYLKLSGGTLTDDLHISTTSPDLYLHTTTTNFGNSAWLWFHGTNDAGRRVGTAVVFSDNGVGALRLRNYKRQTEAEFLANNEQLVIQSELLLRDNYIHASTVVTTGANSNAISSYGNGTVLTSRDYVSDTYVPFRGESTINGGLTITDTNTSKVPYLRVKAPSTTQDAAIHFADQDSRDKMSIKIIQGAFTPNRGGYPDAPNTSSGTDTWAFEKYDGDSNIRQSMYFTDSYIQTHSITGKIRTPSTDFANDNGNTLITLDSAKGFFVSNADYDPYDPNAKIFIERTDSSDNETPFAEFSGISTTNVVIKTNDSGNTFQNARLHFEDSDGVVGSIGTTINKGTGEDSNGLIMGNYAGATSNTLSLFETYTYARTGEFRLQGTNVSSGAFFRITGPAKNTEIVRDNASSTTDHDEYFGIVMQNFSKEIVAGVLSDNQEKLKLISSPNVLNDLNPGPNGSIIISPSEIVSTVGIDTNRNNDKSFSITTTGVVSELPVSVTGTAIPSSTSAVPTNNEFATNNQLVARTYEKFTLSGISQYALVADPGSNDSERNAWVRTDVFAPSYPTVPNDFPDQSLSIAGLTRQNFHQLLMQVTLSFPYTIFMSQENNQSFVRVPVNVEVRNSISGVYSQSNLGHIHVFTDTRPADDNMRGSSGHFTGTFTVAIVSTVTGGAPSGYKWRFTKDSFGGATSPGSVFDSAAVGNIQVSTRII